MDKNEEYTDIDEMILPDKLIGQGNTAEIYQLEEGKILKLYREGFSKYAIEREYHNSLQVMGNLDCVPMVYGRVSIDNRQGIVFQQIYGTDMIKKMLTNPWKIRYYAKKFSVYHSQVLCPISGGLQPVKEKIKDDIIWEMDLSDIEKKIIIEFMEKLPDGNVLCHYDFHPGNIVLSAKGPYVIDWMNACVGDACADIARTCLLMKYGELIHASKFLRMMFAIIKRQIYKVYIKKCPKIFGKSMEDISKWELPVAAARLNETLTENERQALVHRIKELLSTLG